MTTPDLARLVAEMRIAQKEYFRVRSPSALERSKSLERRVDQAVLDRLDTNVKLFGEDADHA